MAHQLPPLSSCHSLDEGASLLARASSEKMREAARSASSREASGPQARPLWARQRHKESANSPGLGWRTAKACALVPDIASATSENLALRALAEACAAKRGAARESYGMRKDTLSSHKHCA